MMDLQSLMDRAQRHLRLALAFDVALCGLVYGLIISAWWCPLIAGVMVGLLMWFMICEDYELQAILVMLPKLAIYSILYGLTFFPVVGVGVQALERWMDRKWPRKSSVEVSDGKQ